MTYPVNESLAERVLATLKNTPEGLTDFEIAGRLDAYLSSVNATRNALMKRGKVRRSGVYRPSGRGGMATVWVAA
ncbi:hypothetical protein [Micromonospora coerulea]|uniref:hypothetical protein n=1 Tax=Micromonospora coerulea TaxID=47856 RepID=UPI001903E8E8|nr:hypothetical protein [Micromonospora veneta]